MGIKKVPSYFAYDGTFLFWKFRTLSFAYVLTKYLMPLTQLDPHRRLVP
ncbi:hypothetical protein B0I21_105267 [Sphingobacterium paludis]|uniref:Uncharacterized protein n=1 Tax=Sphingobacterium paludis TaxID=1476465 RepID=A0A4R7CX82_9SPHI|nr:hypothetical protein B0I21_105267 [Sphingobacterium paludis]